MAGMISTLILNVDLDCHRCYKRIRKTVCKLQEKESIKSVSYDEKNGTVTISGPFDPDRLSKKLRCKACKVIKSIQIKEEKKEEKEEEKKEEKEEEKKEEKEDKKEAEKTKIEPVLVTPYFWPPGPVCCLRPCLEVYYGGGCRCCSCGRVVSEPAVAYPPAPAPAPYYYPQPYKCQIICDEGPPASCTLM